MKRPLVIIIGGPTASGKSVLAANLAAELNTEVINADSRQFYKELNVGVARPSSDELSTAKHHFVASETIHKPLSAGSFAENADQILNALFHKQPFAVVSGGSGLYLNALLYGFDDLSSIPVEISRRTEEIMSLGNEFASQELLKLSPDSADLVDHKNPVRVKRALDLVLAHQKPLSQIWRGNNRPPRYNHAGFYINPDRKILYNSINQRVFQMVEAGLVNEAKELMKYRHLNPLKTIGYTEMFEYLDGLNNLNTAIALIQQHTRNYAKRQLTWLKNKTDYTPISAETGKDIILEYLKINGYLN